MVQGHLGKLLYELIGNDAVSLSQIIQCSRKELCFLCLPTLAEDVIISGWLAGKYLEVLFVKDIYMVSACITFQTFLGSNFW